MTKQHMYEVTLAEIHTCTVLVAASSVEEAKLRALDRYDHALLAFEFSEIHDPACLEVKDLGEDPGQ